MTEDIYQEIEDVNDEFALTVKDYEDIVEEINFDTEDEKLTCSSIIENMEKCIANNLKNEKCVNIPYIGNLRKNAAIMAINKHKQTMAVVRKHMSKEEYKEHVRGYVQETKQKQKELDKEKFVIKKLKNKYKKRYKLLYSRSGKAHAELFIKSLLWFKPVPFDQEVQDAYDNLKN